MATMLQQRRAGYYLGRLSPSDLGRSVYRWEPHHPAVHLEPERLGRVVRAGRKWIVVDGAALTTHATLHEACVRLVDTASARRAPSPVMDLPLDVAP